MINKYWPLQIIILRLCHQYKVDSLMAWYILNNNNSCLIWDNSDFMVDFLSLIPKTISNCFHMDLKPRMIQGPVFISDFPIFLMLISFPLPLPLLSASVLLGWINILCSGYVLKVNIHFASFLVLINILLQNLWQVNINFASLFTYLVTVLRPKRFQRHKKEGVISIIFCWFSWSFSKNYLCISFVSVFYSCCCSCGQLLDYIFIIFLQIFFDSLIYFLILVKQQHNSTIIFNFFLVSQNKTNKIRQSSW